MKNVIILGGGISGLSLAWKLGNQGIKSCILESGHTVGGLAGTLRENGYCMDIGPHSFFSEDTEILNIVLDLFESAVIPRERSVKFFYQGKFLDYPLTAYSVLFQMGLWSGLHAGLSFIKSKLTPRKIIPEEEETVEDWAVQSFGNHLYQTFFKPYTEQFWKISCSELSSRSIPTHTRMSFFNTLRLLFRRRFSKTDWSLIEREMLPTYYPETGFQEIAEHIAEQAKRNGATICLGCRAIGLENTQNNRVRVRYESDQLEKQIEGSHVISTIPLNQLVKMIKPLPPPDVLAAAGRLDYRSLIALGMVTEKQNILNCSYIYVLNRPYNRISEMNEFSPYTSPSGENILVVEIPCLYGSAAWNASREELFDICIGSLAEDGFIMPGDVKRLLLYKMPFAYPIYRKGYISQLRCLLNYIDDHPFISTLGRCGEFMYMDVDKCIRRAFDLAEHFSTGSEKNIKN